MPLTNDNLGGKLEVTYSEQRGWKVLKKFQVGQKIVGISIKRIKPGTNGKIAIIGRSMKNHVENVAEYLTKQGIEVEVFNLKCQKYSIFDIEGKPYTWQNILDDFNDLKKYSRNTNGWIIDADLPNTLMFKANKIWINKLQRKGFEVLDVGYPKNISSPSVFYNMELNELFGI